MSTSTQRQPETPSGPDKVNHVRRVLWIWLGLSIIGIALSFVIVPLLNPTSASDAAGFANVTDLVFTVLAVPVAVFVWVFIFYRVFVFRSREPKSASVDELEDGEPIEAKPRIQVAWLAITGGLAIFLVGWGMIGLYKQTTDNPPHPLIVQVTGQQWTWTYDYPALGVQSTTLMLPKGRPVEFRITSSDVLHGFVVNGLGVAMDANPGWWTTAPIVTPTKLGNYATRCMELCGLYHSYMWSPVKVVPASTFSAWVTANGGNPIGTGTKAGG